jgi:hypothetical protein
MARIVFRVARGLLKGDGAAKEYLNEQSVELLRFIKGDLSITWDTFKYFFQDVVNDCVSSELVKYLSLMSEERLADVFESALLGGQYTEQLMTLVAKEAGLDLDIFETLLRTGSLLSEWRVLDPCLGIVGPGISSLAAQTIGDQYLEPGSIARITRTLRTLATAS